MTVFFGSDYVTQINDLVFTPTGGQFGPDVTGFNYDEFFGIGEDDLVGDSFSIGGPVNISLPFIGDVELFRGRIFGELGVQFGIQVSSTLDPGTVDAVLPYQTIVAFPDVIAANAVDGDVLDVFFSNEFRPQDSAESGFTTEFPSFTFDLGLVTELVAELAAEVGALGNNTTIQLLDFQVPETLIPILSVDTNRDLPNGDANPIELFGVDSQTLANIGGLNVVEDGDGNLTGFGIPLNTFASSPSSDDRDTTDASPEGDETPDASPPDFSGIDLGSIEIFIPNINTASSGFVDGVFVTDPNQQAVYNRDAGGNLTSITRENDPTGEGNRDDVAVLTLDLDGLITYATGGTFPPLELDIDILDGSIGPINLDAGFSYNLIDVELEAALPLEQEFTLTPKLETQFKFFEAEPDGSKGAEKFVDVRMNQKVLNFDQTGTFQDDALEARLQQLAESNATFAQDVSLFIDFNDGVPGAFTGATASLGGAMMISRDGGATFQRLGVEDTDPVAFSAPVLGQNQNVDLTIDDQTVLAYRLFIGSGSAEVSEDYIIEFDKTDTIFVEDVREITTPITETPFLEELDALNLVYDADDTFVEVVTKSTPTITNRTGLEFDLALLLSGLAASANFNASVDIGPFTIGTGLNFDLGPLFEERFELLNLDIIDLFNGSFNIEEEQVQSFVLGDAAVSDFGDAIVGTSGNDTLNGTSDDDEIIGLGGDDTIIADAGNDTIFLGDGAATVDGGAGFDIVDLTEQASRIRTSNANFIFADDAYLLDASGAREGVYVFTGSKSFQSDVLVFSFDQVANASQTTSINKAGAEKLVLGDLADKADLSGSFGGLGIEEIDLGGGNDFIVLSNINSPITVQAGAGDDLVDYPANIIDGTGVLIDGGEGHNYLRRVTNIDLDLETGTTSSGITFQNFQSVDAFSGTTNNTFSGTDEANTLAGAGGDDTLIGRGGNDLLVGGDDDDVFFGGAGSDSFVGGTGLDTASYSDSATSVFIDLDFGGVARGFRGEAQGDSFSSVENIIGSDFEDIIIGNNASNTLSGGEGNDRLQSQDEDDLLQGGAGNDLLNRGDIAGNGSSFNNVYDGGEGFDIAAFDVVDPFTRTGSTTGKAEFTYIVGGFNSTTTETNKRDMTINLRWNVDTHLDVVLGEDGNGTVQYIEADGERSLLATRISGTADFSHDTPDSIVDFFPGYNKETTTYNNNITDQTRDELLDDSISYTRDPNGVFDGDNGSGKVIGVGSVPIAVDRNVLGTETLIDIEGIIGSRGNDFLTGNSQDNAFFGNGGDDLIKAGEGDDRLGFGEAQSLNDVFSFPGSIANPPLSPGPGFDPRVFFTLEQRLKALDPNGVGIDETGVIGSTASGNPTQSASIGEAIIPVGKIELNADGATDDIGSFLWGQGGDDTLDLRFDRGIDFFPVISDTRAVVDLDIATASSPINNFTGTVIEYGRASYVDAEGTELNFATTFGVDNVIGTGNADTITGDRNNNSIEGGDGADLLDGDDGFDTLSYALADEGVTLNFRDDGGSVVMDNGRETITGAGDAAGDVASNFESIIGTDFDDTVILDYETTITQRSQTAQFQVPINVQVGTTGFPSFNPIFSTILQTRSAQFQMDAIPNISGPAMDLGAGDDDVQIGGTRRQTVDLGEGNDTVSLKNGGHSIDAGEGDDVITISNPDQAVYFSQALATTSIDGGEGEDTVVINGNLLNSLTLQDGVAIVTQGVNVSPTNTTFFYSDPLVGTRSFFFGNEPEVQQARQDALTDGGPRYELTNVEFVEINGQRIRIDNPDPIVDADKTLNLIEDQIDAYDMDLSIPGTDIDNGATFEILELPTTAFLQTPGGVFLSVGETVSATDMAGLQVVPGQNFDPDADKFTYLRTGDAPEEALSKQLPDTVRGVALNITSHLTEETVETVAETPAAPTVALAGLNPGLDVGTLPLAEALNYAQQADLATMPTGAMTYELLFRSFGPLDPDGPDQVFASYAVAGNNNEFLINGYKDGRGLEISYNGTRIETGVRTDMLYDREMHRLSVTVDPDANKMQLLIDGVLMFDQEITINGGIDTGGFFIIGQEQDIAPGEEDGFNENQTLSGEIGDVRIWNGVRTEAEVAETAFAEVSDPDLVANWRADTTNQGVMVDVVGGEHLALINSPDVVDVELPELAGTQVIRTVRVNVAPEDDQAIQVGNFAMPTGPMTIETIIQFHDDFESGQGRQHFISYAVSGSFNELLVFVDQSAANPVIGLIVNGSQTILTDVPGTALMDGEAHRFSMIFDPDADLIQVYIDGEQVYSQTHVISPIATGGFLNFGQDQDSLGGGFQPLQMAEASYGDMRVWDGALDAETIAKNAFAPLADPASEANLVANWQVDITNTTSVPDVLGGTALSQVDNPAFSAVTFPVSAHIEALVSLNAGGVTDQYIEAANVALPEGDISLEWYYNAPDPITLGVNDFLTFLSYAVPGVDNQIFMFAFDNEFGNTIFINLGGTGFDTGIPLTALAEGGPHRVSITVDTASDELVFYIDGDAVFTGTGNAIAGNPAGGTLIFGQEQDEVGGGFQTSDILVGEVGDIRIWDNVRTAEEVAENAFVEFDDATGQDGLVNNWQADKATLTELVDLVGGPAMTVQNAAPIVNELIPGDGVLAADAVAPEVTSTTQLVDQQGDVVTIRVDEVPTDGTVFYMEPDPDLLAMGITFDVEVPVAAGQTLTPAQLEGLFFRADDNFTGDPGSFRYSVTDDVAFRQLAATSQTEVDNRTDGTDNDGSASQTISFDVTPVNDAPVIGNVLFPISPGAEFESTVRVVDTEDDDFTVALTTAPTFGTVVVNPDGSFTYQQNAVIDFAGAAFIEDVFEVTATETASGSFFSNVEPASSGPQRQVIRIINPDLATDIVFDETDDSFFDDEGNPINIGGLATDDVIIGHSGKDGLFGFGGHDTVSGREDDDMIFGGIGNDTLNGEAGNDTLAGEEGSDTLDGGEGIDTADYSAETSAVTVTASSATNGGAAAGDRLIDVENIIGTDFNDILNGDAVSNKLEGGSGNDTLNGFAGADTMEGGAGNDRFFVDDAGDVVVELAGEGTDLVSTSVSIVMAENVENASTFGSAAVEITGNGLNNFITGNAASNVLKGAGGNDRLQGQAGNDTLEGGEGNDILEGQAGEDVLKFGLDAGNDIAFGFELGLDKLDFTDLGLRFVQLSFVDAAGSTRVEYDNGLGGTASVNLQGISLTQITSDIMVDPSGLGSPGGGIPLFEGDTGNNDLVGSAAGEDFVGGLGNDRFFALGGDDTMVGGFGNDRYFVTDAGDVVIEQAFQGTDQVDTTISLTLGESIENGAVSGDNAVDITGNALNNFITGSNQTNVLLGGGGRDRLIAFDGDDTLNGGADRDVLEGGLGADVFVFEADSGIDLITDFEVGVDVIDISALGIAYADMRIQDGPLGAQVFLDLTPGSVDLITLNGVSGSELLLDSFITSFGANQPPIVGTPGNDNLSGSQIGDELQGLGGNDLVNGAGGADTMIGGDGDDTYTVDNVGDVVVELPGEGTDRVNARVDVTLSDNVENGSAVFGTGAGGVSEEIDVTGNALDNALTGNDADNVLIGLDGADNLQGIDGADTLNGGTGNDILRGGADADTFAFNIGDGDDLILDFEIGTDTIDLSVTGLDFADLTIQAQDANALVEYGADSILFVNTDAGLLSSADFDFGP